MPEHDNEAAAVKNALAKSQTSIATHLGGVRINTSIAALHGHADALSRRPAPQRAPNTQSALHGQPEALAGGTHKKRDRIHRRWRPGAKGERSEHQQQEREKHDQRRQERGQHEPQHHTTHPGDASGPDHHVATQGPNELILVGPGKSQETTSGAKDPRPLDAAGAQPILTRRVAHPTADVHGPAGFVPASRRARARIVRRGRFRGEPDRQRSTASEAKGGTQKTGPATRGGAVEAALSSFSQRPQHGEHAP